MFALLALALLSAGIVARIAIFRAAAASAVDQHYWMLAARAYREQRGLPVRIPGKYLLEDETQAYPPLFGWLLGRVSNTTVLRWVTPAVETAGFLALWAVLLALGVRWDMMTLALACYVAAPVLVVYNAQLTSRVLGDFFLFSAMALQLVAVVIEPAPWLAWLCWIASAGLLGMMVMTHKMSLQLHVVLMPVWWWSLSAWQVPVATLIGLALFVIVVGPAFARYQLCAHWEIVNFWNRHWRNLGAHQFDLSPVYGNPDGDRSACFHAPGWRGALKHLRVVVSYAPLNVLLPVCSLLTEAWPPAWVLVWLGAIYVWALATLYVPGLKRWGGGHLYVFNAVAPGAIYLSFLPADPMVFVVVAVGVILTVISLAMAWRIVVSRQTARCKDFEDVIDHLRKLPVARIAVFPLQAAEAVAAGTPHAVLWGGHGYGFGQMEGFFPVLTRPLGEFFHRHRVTWVCWDTGYWPKGESILIGEGLIQAATIIPFGVWRLARVGSVSE